MRKRAFFTALFFGFCTMAMLHSGSKTTVKGLSQTGLKDGDLLFLKANAKAYYKMELNETVADSDIIVPYDAAEVYFMDDLTEQCNVVTLQVRVPMEEKIVYRYITYRIESEENGEETLRRWTIIHEGYERI